MQNSIGIPQPYDRVFVIKALIVFRMVVISFFLGTVIVFQQKIGALSFPIPISVLIIVTYMVSILYLFMLERISRYTFFLYSQLLLDLLIEGGIIFYTGGVMSPFTFLYMFTIIATSIVLVPPASYVMASIASISYGLLVNLEYYGVINPLPLLERAAEPPTQGYIFFTVLIHIAAFYLIAFLSDFLSQTLRKTLFALTVKSEDLTFFQEFHENVITNMGSGFLALDMERRINSANHAAEEILGEKLKNFKLQKIEELFPAVTLKKIMPDLDDDTGKAKNTEFIYKTEKDEDKNLSATSSLFKDSQGKVRGFIVIFQDITQFKKMESAIAKSERLAAIGRMAAGLAHEIRNPLGSISGSIQMLKSEIIQELSPPHEKLMAIILRETDRLNGIISRFLSYASPPKKKSETVNLASLINDTVILFRNDAEYSSQIKIDARLDERVLMKADPESIKQVFWNLMLNAAQAMPGSGKIEILMEPEFNENRGTAECVIHFSDNGLGIPDEEIKKIFEPFHTTKEKGTGLGLPTVLKIIENHNGTINVASVPGKGTTFKIVLPVIPISLSV